jgi:Bardet-Biedl syndrome 4 protein
LNPTNTSNLKQVGHSLFLLGRHEQAIEVYEEARRIGNEARTRGRVVGGGDSTTTNNTNVTEDWEILHNQGLCLRYLQQHEQAVESFRRANEASPHDVTFQELGKTLERIGDLAGAKQCYKEALTLSAESAELLTSFGLLSLRLGDSAGSLQLLTRALAFNPRHPKALLAWGSISQDAGRHDAAILRYRVAATAGKMSASAQLWNNGKEAIRRRTRKGGGVQIFSGELVSVQASCF